LIVYGSIKLISINISGASETSHCTDTQFLHTTNDDDDDDEPTLKKWLAFVVSATNVLMS